ncbi:YggT family protein [Actinoplanes sp. GCM10030250]|uniref:YggT family protein n=1 Tax=Actinoplanes sp. GCM10030250 TaxID=3273376 RepID=UPI00360C8D59
MGLLGLVDLLLLLVQIVLIARAVLDWSVALAGPAMPGSFRSRAMDGVHRITEPMLAPVRRILPPLRVGGVSIDLAFIVLFVVIGVLRTII